MMMEGFPNLFMVSGPMARTLANLIAMAEHDVDWIAKVITHMAEKGQATVEPLKSVEDQWLELVYTLAQKTLVSKAKTWYVGANVQDKPQGLSMFTGGFLKYKEHAAAATQNGYKDFHFR